MCALQWGFLDRRWHIKWSNFSKHPMQRKHSHPDRRFLQCLSICTHPNQCSSCKTYFTEMALPRGGQGIKGERFIYYPLISVTVVMWRNPDGGGCPMCELAFCHVAKFILTLTKHNHWSGICESLWILISRFWINHRFIYLCIFLSLCVSLWLPKHPPTGEPQQHPS